MAYLLSRFMNGPAAGGQRGPSTCAYSDEMGHRFRCKWGSIEASDAGYSHHRRSAPIQSRFLCLVRAVSIISFPSSRFSPDTVPMEVGRPFRSMWGGVPTEMERSIPKLVGHPFRTKWGSPADSPTKHFRSFPATMLLRNRHSSPRRNSPFVTSAFPSPPSCGGHGPNSG
jgi:hypothetical protein